MLGQSVGEPAGERESVEGVAGEKGPDRVSGRAGDWEGAGSKWGHIGSSGSAIRGTKLGGTPLLDGLRAVRIGPLKIEYSHDEARGALKSIEVFLCAAF